MRFRYEYQRDADKHWQIIAYASEDIWPALQRQADLRKETSIDDYLRKIFVGTADSRVILARYDAKLNAIVVTFAIGTPKLLIDGESYVLAAGEACGYERSPR